MSRALVLSLLICSALWAQEFRATLSGRVTDPSGAPVVNAAVRLTNVDTGERFPAKTTGSGDYTFALVKPGNYEIRAGHEGFKAFVRQGLKLEVNQSATFNIALQLGAVSETITVRDEAPLLATATADRGGVIDEQTIKEMPLNGATPSCSRCWFRV